jgi:hypothetical protein
VITSRYLTSTGATVLLTEHERSLVGRFFLYAVQRRSAELAVRVLPEDELLMLLYGTVSEHGDYLLRPVVVPTFRRFTTSDIDARFDSSPLQGIQETISLYAEALHDDPASAYRNAYRAVIEEAACLLP